MFWFKSCPRCQGDLWQDSDVYGPFVACIQCGHYLSEAEEAWMRLIAARPAVHPVAPVELERMAA